MRKNKSKLLKVACVIGYGLFIGATLLQSFDSFAQYQILESIKCVGLGFGSSVYFVYLLNKDNSICRFKEKMFQKNSKH